MVTAYGAFAEKVFDALAETAARMETRGLQDVWERCVEDYLDQNYDNVSVDAAVEHINGSLTNTLVSLAGVGKVNAAILYARAKAEYESAQRDLDKLDSLIESLDPPAPRPPSIVPAFDVTDRPPAPALQVRASDSLVKAIAETVRTGKAVVFDVPEGENPYQYVNVRIRSRLIPFGCKLRFTRKDKTVTAWAVPADTL